METELRISNNGSISEFREYSTSREDSEEEEEPKKKRLKEISDEIRDIHCEAFGFSSMMLCMDFRLVVELVANLTAELVVESQSQNEDDEDNGNVRGNRNRNVGEMETETMEEMQMETEDTMGMEVPIGMTEVSSCRP
nr:hypothetical protein [Tanacetum cinerariifolium]